MCGPAEADMFQARSWEEVSLATIMKCEREKSSPGSAPFSGDSQQVWGPREEAFQVSGMSVGAGVELLQILAPGSAGRGGLGVLRSQSRAGVVTLALPEHPTEQPHLPNLLSCLRSGGWRCAMEAAPGSQLQWETLKGVIPTLAVPGDTTCLGRSLGSLGSGMWCPYSGNHLLEHGTGELCQDSPCSMPQVQQDPPDPSGSSSSSTASVLQPQLHAPSSRPRWPGMALCLESQLQ